MLLQCQTVIAARHGQLSCQPRRAVRIGLPTSPAVAQPLGHSETRVAWEEYFAQARSRNQGRGCRSAVGESSEGSGFVVSPRHSTRKRRGYTGTPTRETHSGSCSWASACCRSCPWLAPLPLLVLAGGEASQTRAIRSASRGQGMQPDWRLGDTLPLSLLSALTQTHNARGCTNFLQNRER